jgi:hypothetical protein
MQRGSLEVRRSGFLEPSRASRVACANLKRRLEEETYFLVELAAISPGEVYELEGSRRPRNLAAFFVLRDAAAIFEWFTWKKAGRGVHRIERTETGPFHRFASVLWPVVFEKGTQGLPAAMKNWAQEKSRSSALIANIGLRHPTWRIFECSGPNTPLCDQVGG